MDALTRIVRTEGRRRFDRFPLDWKPVEGNLELEKL